MTPQQAEIVKAIEAELEIGGRKRSFKVVAAARQQSTIRLTVRSQPNGGQLDHTLEGGVASWGKTASPVLAVSIEDGSLYLHRIDKPLPSEGEEITVQPPRFLESLLRCWLNDDLASQCFDWAAHALVGREQRPLLLSQTFEELRPRQRLAYSLLSYQGGFLWGPPGTGKTRTAASMVADFISSDPAVKVLLLAPTNSAVDQLLIAADDRLAVSSRGQQLRTECSRIGSNFIARYYENRQHLLPQGTDKLVLEKASLEALQPSIDDMEARAEWQQRMDRVVAALRSEVDLILREKRVVAMTTTLATMQYKVIQEHSPFDLVVFDEASQTGRAISLMLAPLARRALIAGDPNQLAPIFSSNHQFARKWFGLTLFDDYMHPKHPSTCFLNEQSRMAAPICSIVSKMFYNGDLRVSDDCLRNSDWQVSRRPFSLFPAGPIDNVHLINVDTEPTSHGSSHRRQKSAEIVSTIAQRLAARVDPSKILILTPFVAQRKLIRKALDAKNLRKTRVSTVHAAQGTEIHTVIFDPVKGDSWFLNKPENKNRLLNVAISRAQACFVLIASAGDLQHPVLAAIAAYIKANQRREVVCSGL